MFRRMRLEADNQLTQDETVKILKNSTYGVLALGGDDDYPYAVPVNFAYSDNKIFFHGATEGYKVDAVRKNDKVSFCTVAKADIIADKYNCLYLSAIAFGKIRIIEDSQEKQKAMELIIDKYSKEFKSGGLDYIKTAWDDVMTFEIQIEHVTGKKGTP